MPVPDGEVPVADDLVTPTDTITSWVDDLITDMCSNENLGILSCDPNYIYLITD